MNEFYVCILIPSSICFLCEKDIKKVFNKNDLFFFSLWLWCVWYGLGIMPIIHIKIWNSSFYFLLKPLRYSLISWLIGALMLSSIRNLNQYLSLEILARLLYNKTKMFSCGEQRTSCDVLILNTWCLTSILLSNPFFSCSNREIINLYGENRAELNNWIELIIYYREFITIQVMKNITKILTKSNKILFCLSHWGWKT